jgi:hypothetical protein
MLENIKISKSKLHKDFIIVEVFNDLFKFSDDAVCNIEDKIIVINGSKSKNWNMNNYLSIEAHEISHYLLEHKEYGNFIFEKEADTLGYLILLINFKFKASKILKMRYKLLYNGSIIFNIKYKFFNKLIKYLKEK